MQRDPAEARRSSRHMSSCQGLPPTLRTIDLQLQPRPISHCAQNGDHFGLIDGSSAVLCPQFSALLRAKDAHPRSQQRSPR